MVSEGNTLLDCGTKPTPRWTSGSARRLRDVLAVQRHRAGADVHQPEQRLEQRRLAGAVRADDADELAGVHDEVAPVEDVRRRACSPRTRSVASSSGSPVGAPRWTDSAPVVAVVLMTVSSWCRVMPPPRRAPPPSSCSASRRPAGCRRRGPCRGAAQVGVDHGLVVHDGSGGPSATIRPSAMTIDPVRDVPDHVHVVLDEQHRGALVAQRLDVAEERLRERGVHAGHRLVEHDHRRLAHQGAGHLEQLALTAGQAAGEVVALGVELEPREQLLGLDGDLASRACATAAGTSAATRFSPGCSVAPSRMFSMTVMRLSALVSWNVRTMPDAGDPAAETPAERPAVERPGARCSACRSRSAG